MNFRARRVQTATVEITPLIDVVFILLIFYMVTSTFVSTSRLDISLPESTAATSAQPPDSIEVYVSADGEFSINGSAPQVTTKEAVFESVRAIVKSDEDPLVLIHADADSRHQAVVHVLTALAELNLKQVHLVSMQIPDLE